MRQKAKPARRWPWYVAIGVLSVCFTIAIQGVAVAIAASRTSVCGNLELISLSRARACKWQLWTTPSEWWNWRFAIIAGVVAVIVGLALWDAGVMSRVGLQGGPRDKHIIRAEYQPIVVWLVAFTCVAMLLLLVIFTSGVAP